MPEKSYAHRAVTDKLGLQPGMAVRLVGIRPEAAGAQAVLTQAAARIGRPWASARARAEVVLYWPKTAAEIVPTLARLKAQIVDHGGIWVITAKKGAVSASGMGYFKQDDLIPMGAAAGLVDNKICAFSELESAMRFVIRKEDRGRPAAGGR